MSDQVKVGVVGTSWWTDLLHLPSFASHPDAEIAAICGRRRAPAQVLAAKYRIDAIYTDYRDLLAHDGLDAVLIATPDDTHHEMTMAALDAGLHVMCEKPLANNATDAKEMLDRAEAAGVIHMVLFTWRLLPYSRYLKRLVDQGFIGKCQRIELSFVSGRAHDPAYQWRFDGARSNGALGDLGPHLIDMFRTHAGEIESVSADLQQIIDRSNLAGPVSEPVNDSGTILLRGLDGTRGEIRVGAARPVGDRDTVIGVSLVGADGTLESELILAGAEKGLRLRGIGSSDIAFRNLRVPEDLLEGLAADDYLGPITMQSVGPRLFVDSILANAAPPMTFRDGWKAQQVVDAALQSDRERRWVDIV